MKARLLAMASLAVILVAAALLWLMDAKVQEERKIASEVGLRGPVNALSQALQANIRGLRRAFPPGTQLLKDRIDWEAFKPFYALAQIRTGKNQSQIMQFVNDGVWPQMDWTTDLVASMVSSVPSPGDGETTMAVVESLNKKKVFMTLIRDGDREWAAFAGLDFLQGLLDLQKGPKGWISILNRDGQVLGHSVSEYVGTKVSAGSLSDQIRIGAGARGFETMQAQGAESSLVAFEKPEHTDLVILAARPVAELQSERRKALLYGGLSALGILLLLASALWGMLGQWETLQAKELAAAKAAAVPVVTSAPSPTAAALLKERQETFHRIASALGHELRSPLVSILGYAQMALGSTQDRKVTESVDSILRETRTARDLVDKLLAFAGDATEEKSKGRVETALTRVLQEFDPRFAQRHIHVNKDFRETSEIELVPGSLEKALRHLLNNAMEAMERMPKKELTLRLVEDAQSVTLEIRDNGEGMDEATKARIFDPFFTTRQSAQHLGMGLPAAQGLVHECGGQLRIQTAVGAGTTVSMILSKVAKTVSIAGDSVRLRTEEIVQVPEGVPMSRHDVPPPPEPKSLVDVDIEQLLSVPKVPPPAPLAAEPTSPAIAEVNVEAKDETLSAPHFAPPLKKSPLTTFPVEIRRPGSRS